MQEKSELLLEQNDFTNLCYSWVSSIPMITETFDFRRQYADTRGTSQTACRWAQCPRPENSRGGSCLLFSQRNNREPNPGIRAECSFVLQPLIYYILKSFQSGGTQLLWLLIYPLSLSSIQMFLREARRLPSHQNTILARRGEETTESGRWEVACHHWQRQLWPWAIYLLSYVHPTRWAASML